MQSVTKRIEELLISNREALLQADTSISETQNGICSDGIVDEECFYIQPQRAIFLLKETNGNDSRGKARESYNNWDYRGWLQHQQANSELGDEENSNTFYKTFYNVCMYLDVFYDVLADKCIPYEEYMASGRFNTEILRKNLRKTAIINLKKTWGGGSTEWKALNNYLQNEKVLEVLRKEITYINPDVVICGGKKVFDFAKKIFGGEEQELPITGAFKANYFQTDNSVFLSFYHPSCRKKRRDLYDCSAEVFRTLHTLL
ncbi:MAG: hypothetical protein KBC20_02045 [Oscillospiraceae bacterium]|nr:hypothetical protein [Oscillospiraceae bacterium]